MARSVFVHPEFQYDSVDLVLTLSTPHNAAPYQFDWHIHSFYRLVLFRALSFRYLLAYGNLAIKLQRLLSSGLNIVTRKNDFKVALHEIEFVYLTHDSIIMVLKKWKQVDQNSL